MCFFLCPSYFLYDAESVSELSVSYRLRWNDGPGVLTAAFARGVNLRSIVFQFASSLCY